MARPKSKLNPDVRGKPSTSESSEPSASSSVDNPEWGARQGHRRDIVVWEDLAVGGPRLQQHKLQTASLVENSGERRT